MGSTGMETLLRSWERSHTSTPAYSDAGQCFSQLRLLTHFVNMKYEMDRLRLLYFGQMLQETLPQLPSVATGHLWTAELSRLATLTLQLVSVSARPSKVEDPPQSLSVDKPLQLLSWLASLIPKELAKESPRYYAALAGLVHRPGPPLPLTTRELLVEAVMVLLKQINAYSFLTYGAFAEQFLTIPDLNVTLGSLEQLAALNYKLLAKALAHMVDDQSLERPATNGHLLGSQAGCPFGAGFLEYTSTDRLLWLLAHFIFLHRQSFGNTFSIAQESDYVKVVSVLLSLTAEQVALRDDLHDQSSTASKTSLGPLPSFVREQIESLRQQNSIAGILSYIGQAHSNQKDASHTADESPDIAKSLATYALTLLRVFPKKAEEIRMWLYRGSSELKVSSGTSAIEYFWLASRNSLVFKETLRSHRKVYDLLKPQQNATQQMGRAPPSKAELDSWKQQWNIIFLFLEMYAFVLKYMDDEEFLSAGDVRAVVPQGVSNNASLTRDGALPLQEVAEMTVFLKNLSFALYWYASEFNDDASESNTVSTFLGGADSEFLNRSTSKVQHGRLTQSISIEYLKSLVTGVLRMLHERDSRRNIFPKDHWLMTTHINLTGFIPAVVAEEEKRHEIQEEDEDEKVIDDIGDDDMEDASTGWDRPNGFQPFGRSNYAYGQSHNPRQARYLQVLQRKQAQAKKKRQLEQLAPRLEILRNLPFFIPFETRVQIFREFVNRDQTRRRNGFVEPDLWRMSIAHGSQGRAGHTQQSFQDTIRRHHAEIHREHIFDDAYGHFYELGEELKEPIQISFIDKFDTIEAGIDGGGVTKEFLTSVTTEAFVVDAGQQSMFVENDQHSLYPNPNAFDEWAELLRRSGFPEGSERFNADLRDMLKRYEFLGRIVGKCLYEGILVDINFAGFFLLKWALTGGTTSASNESAYRANINDLRDLDEQLYQGLLKLKNYTGDVETDFSLNFTVSDNLSIEDSLGNPTAYNVTRDLKPGGADIPVTNANRLAYISLIADYRLKRQPQFVTKYFLRGLGQIIQPMWLAMFNQRELQTLVGGDTNEVDIQDLRRNTQYSGVYFIGDDGREHETIALFWKVLKEMDDKDRRKVLKFVTSTPRAPLLGFSHLNPKFSIRDSGEDQVRLPSTSTCVNLLKLPRYSSKEVLRDKLLYAVNAGAGFDLS